MLELNLTKKLEKGENVALVLEKGLPLTTVRMGLGWDVSNSSTAFDLDSLVVLLGADGKFHSTPLDSVAYFGNLKPLNGAILHHGDNLTGEGDGDDEVIDINLDKLPETVQKVVAGVVIYQAPERGQNFGQVSNAFARIYLPDNSKFVVDDKEVQEIRYDLTEDHSVNYSVQVVEIYRHGGSWKIKALDKGAKKDLQAFLNEFSK